MTYCLDRPWPDPEDECVGEAKLDFGKHRLRMLEEVWHLDPNYLAWLDGVERLPPDLRRSLDRFLDSVLAPPYRRAAKYAAWLRQQERNPVAW